MRAILRRLMWADLWLPALFMILVLVVGPGIAWNGDDPDEGFNLMKAFLCLNGYELYTQIWSDQPPVLTFLLEQLFRVAGPSVEAGRALVLVFSALLLWTLFRLLKSLGNPLAAGIAVLLLVASNKYVDWSVSVMIGLPALTLALLSLYWFIRYLQTSRTCWLIASAAIMALSLHTKLFTLLLLPLFPLAYATVPRQLESGERGLRSAARALATWLLALTAAWLCIHWHFQVDFFGQLVQPHAVAAKKMRSGISFQPVQQRLIEHWLYFLLAGVGAWQLWRRRQWDFLVPWCWIGLTLLALSWHRPIHKHYVLLLTIPLSWSAALGVSWAVRELLDWRQHLGTRQFGQLATAGLALILMAVGTLQGLLQFSGGRSRSENDESRIVVKLMSEAKPRWVFTDRPFLAFCAASLVPPEAAVLSGKRWVSDDMDSRRVLAILDRYQPEQVLLGRFSYDAEVMSYLEARYTTVYQGGKCRLYQLRAGEPGRAEESE